MCSFAWAAMWGQKNLSYMRSSMCSRFKWPTSLWHPLRATSFCTAGRTNWRRVSSDSLGLAHLYRIPCLSNRWLHSHLYWLISDGSVALDWPFPSILSCSLAMTRFRTWSVLGVDASPLRLYKWPADCPGLHPGCEDHNCRPLWGLWALWGQPLVQLTLLWLWPLGEYLTVSYTPQPGYP